ncbi:hypothetical protein [Frigoriglobus tundricola]|nr:hypothetical protein [Frigoriglobus tundricola]
MPFHIQSGATATYHNGVLVGVNATATGPTLITVNQGTVNVGGSVAPIAYDAADTVQSFTLPDGTVGAISMTIPWDQVDSTQASQSLTPTALNLNIAGQNFAYGSANYTIAPTLLFSNGTFQGVNFSLNTAAVPGFAYTTVALNGLNATITAATGQQFLVAAPPTTTMLGLDFSAVQTASFTYDMSINVTYTDGTSKTVDFSVPAGTTNSGLRDMVYSALKGAGLPETPVLSGNNRLIVEGTAKAALKTVWIQAAKQPKSGLNPSVVDLKVNGQLNTPTVTPNLIVKPYQP